jgi:hypothetical protein
MRVSQVRTLVLTGLKNDRANLSRQPSFCHFSRTDPLMTPSLVTLPGIVTLARKQQAANTLVPMLVMLKTASKRGPA